MLSKTNEELVNRLKDLQLKLNSKQFNDNNIGEVEYIKKRVSDLESDTKSITASYNKEMSKYKIQSLERSTADILRVNNSERFFKKDDPSTGLIQRSKVLSSVIYFTYK